MNNADKVILDLCGGTGSWSKPYKDAGYDVRLITLPANDVRNYEPPPGVYGILAAPPCTMFSFARTRGDKVPRNLDKGMETVLACLRIIWQCQKQLKSQYQQVPPLRFWAMENPWGMLNWFIGHPAFTFDPWEFGDFYTKKTCLWGYFNSPAKTWHIKPTTRKYDQLTVNELSTIRGLPTVANIGTKRRQELRSITPAGFATAFFEANR